MAFFSPRLVMGVTIMGLGMVMILDRLGLVYADTMLQFWPVLIVLFGASIVVQSLQPASADDGSIRHRRSGFPGLFLLIFFIAVFGWNGTRRSDGRVLASGSDGINLAGVMSSTRGTVTTDFHGGHLTSVMGRATLDLREAKLAPGQEAVVDVFVTMGRGEILVPPDWTVDMSALPAMGAAEDNRWRGPAGDAAGNPPRPRLVVRGFVMMGKVDIN